MVGMQNFVDAFKTSKQSFIGAFSVCMTTPLTLYRMEGEGGKKVPYQFSPVTSTNVEASPQNVLSFSFDPFATLV